MELHPIIWVIPVAGLAAIAFALYLAWDVLRADRGTPAMQDIAGTIFEGAVAFIRRQYRTIGLLALGGALVIGRDHRRRRDERRCRHRYLRPPAGGS